MMHKAWSKIEDVPCCFPRSSVKFQGHTGQKKSPIFSRIERFRTVTPVWIHRWLWNDAQRLTNHRCALLFFKAIHQISRSHGTKKSQILTWIVRFRTVTPVYFTDGFEMMHKDWCSVEEVPYNFSKSSIKFQGHTGFKIDDWIQFK